MVHKPSTSSSPPLLSVIVPAYDSESSLKQCIDSVFRFGTPESIEVIIVDDCSNDQTNELSKRLCQQYQGIRLHRNTSNLGVARSRNKGISLARGKYITFLDSDDYYQSDGSGPSALNVLSESNYDVVFIPTQNMARNDNLYSRLLAADCSSDSPKSLAQRINETGIAVDECNGCLIRREFLIDKDISFPEMSVGEDKVFMCSLALKTKTFSYLDQIHYVHTARAGGLATAFNARNIDAYSEGINHVKRLHARQREDAKRIFSEHILADLFRSLCFYLLMFYQDRGITYDDESNLNLDWIGKRVFPYFESICTTSQTSYRAILDHLISEILDRIPEDLRNNKGANYIYCLSEYSAAALSVLTYKGIEIKAIIDDSRAGATAYNHAGVHVLSLDDIDGTEQQSNSPGIEKRFFVCHPSEDVFNKITERLLHRGFSEQNIVWIKFFE